MALSKTDIKARTDIASVIGSRISLRKRGRALLGSCPFHEDKKPSFAVYVASNRYECFSCGSHGDVIDFIQEFERVNYGRALEILSGASYDTATRPVLMKKERPVPTVDAPGIMRALQTHAEPEAVRLHAQQLGVSSLSLMELEIGRSDNAWAFPMRDEKRAIVGIRFRAEDGSKWSLKWGRGGLFIPRYREPQRTLHVVEGPTDLAAALTLGMYAIGRANATGQPELVCSFVERSHIKRVVIISDNDTEKRRANGTTFRPGQDGAKRLKELLHIPCEIWIPPAKDLRASLIAGLKRNEIPG